MVWGAVVVVVAPNPALQARLPLPVHLAHLAHLVHPMHPAHLVRQKRRVLS